MAVSKSKTTKTTSKLQLVTKGRKLSAKGRKTLEWLHEQYSGPVELTREQLKQVYDAVLFAAEDRQQTIADITPSDGKYDERDIDLLEMAEAEFARLNRLLYQLEEHFPSEQKQLRLNSQFKLRQELMQARARIGGAA